MAYSGVVDRIMKKGGVVKGGKSMKSQKGKR